jgi:glycosyltransferase involved in cell wall biosynthesis
LHLCRREQVASYHGHDYKSNFLGLLLKRFWPMRLVTTAHGWVKHTSRTPLYYHIDQWCLPRYEQVICVSGDLVEACQRAGVSENRCVLLENGIDLAAYRRTQFLSEAKRALGFDPDRPLVGAVGRLSPEKGFDILIDAIAQVRAGGSPVQLVIVGEGDERARLQAKIDAHGLNPHCRLAGFQAEPKPIYEAMDLFALSSLREGLPNVLLEAMALGVPCAATRVAGVPRLIQDGENGRLVESGDQSALAGAIRDLLGDAAERRRLGQAGQATVAERYSFARRMEKLAGIYDQLLGVQCTVS